MSYRVVRSDKMSYRNIRNSTGSHRVVRSGIASYKYVPSGTVSYRNIRNSTGFYRILRKSKSHTDLYGVVSEENLFARPMCPGGHIFLGNFVLPDRIYCPF